MLVVRRNVTITLDDETARWARVEAAKHDTSVSQFVGYLLHMRMEEQRGYEQARRSYLSRSAQPLRHPDQSYPHRDELHDRAGVR